MKKVFKVIGIIFIVMVIIIGGIFAYTKVKQLMMNNERQNSKTLMEYVRTHSWKYVKGSETMEFVGENLKCNVLNDIESKDIKSVVSSGDTLYIFLNDNSYISLSIEDEKLYSNNQNCIKTNLDIDVKEIKNIEESPYFVSKDNKIYSINFNYDNDKLNFASNSDVLYNFLLLNDDIESVISLSSHEAIVLKKDGFLYKQKYKTNYNNSITMYFLDKEEMFLSKNEYGNIINAIVEYDFVDNMEVKFKINNFLTDKGFYYYGEVKTDKCTKYQDVECEKKILESEIYKKFNKDIKYIGKEYTLLSDNSIIETKYLTYPLDKDLK